jgi:hypothetical protein
MALALLSASRSVGWAASTWHRRAAGLERRSCWAYLALMAWMMCGPITATCAARQSR